MLIAIDAANSSIKICSQNGIITYPNTLREIPSDELSFIKAIDNVFSIDGKKYEVGSEELPSLSGRTGEKYRTEHFVVSVLIAIVHAPGVNRETIELVMGLPCGHSRDEKLKQSLTEKLKGSHEVTKDEKKYTFNISKVRLIAQPLGTLTTILFKDDGEVRDNNSLNSKQLIIDIGWGTTDVVETKGTKITNSLGTDIGIVTAIQKIKNQLSASSTGRGITSLLYLDSNIRKSDLIDAPKGTINVFLLKKHSFQFLADEVVNFIMSSGLKLEEYHRIIFTGGGSLALRPYLKKHNILFNDPRVTFLNNAQTANVRGFYMYGVLAWDFI